MEGPADQSKLVRHEARLGESQLPLGLAELAQGIVGPPAWDGHSLAQELYERRASERRERRKIPEWFAAQDVVWERWERVALQAA